MQAAAVGDAGGGNLGFMGIRTAAAVALVGGGLLAGCGDGPASESLVASSGTPAVLDIVVEDHSILYIEGAVGILQLVDGPTDELGVRAAALLDEAVSRGVWAGHFQPVELAPGEYVVRVWMFGCSGGGCDDDLDGYVDKAGGRSNPDYSCETALRLDAGEVTSIVAAIGRDGCIQIGPESLDRPAARDPLTPTVGDETDVAASRSPILEEDRDRLAEVALALDGVPSDARVVRFEPAFDSEGSLSGAVVVLRHASFSGSVELPGLDLMEVDGREIAVPQVVRYTVDSAAGMHVAIDLRSGEVLWATPSVRSVTATELVSRSETDIAGDPVPSDARQLEGE